MQTVESNEQSVHGMDKKQRVKAGRLIRHALGVAAMGAAALVMAMPAQADTSTVNNQTDYNSTLQTYMTNGMTDTLTVDNSPGTVTIDSGSNVTLPGDGNPLTLDFKNGSTFLVSNAGTASKLTLGSGTTINMLGDSSAPSFLSVGNNGKGELTIADGATIHYTATNPENGYGAGGIFVGTGTSADGHVTMTGGNLIIDADAGNPAPFGVLGVGYVNGAVGVFDQSGGNVTMGNSALQIGLNGTGTYNLSNNGVVSLTGTTVYLGATDGSSGALGVGTLNITDSGQFLFNADTTGGQFFLGDDTGGTGQITQDGANSKVVLDGVNPNRFGYEGGTGTYDLKNGTLVLGGNSGTLLGADSISTGILNQSGGTLENHSDFINPAAVLVVGDSGIGKYNLSGGQATMNYDLDIAREVGSTGTINQSGGTLTLGNNNPTTTYAQIHFGKGDATYNLTGGTLQVASDGVTDPAVVDSTGTYAFNLNGGTIEALNSFTTNVDINLLTGAPSTVNTNAFDITFNGGGSSPGILNKTGAGNLIFGNGINGMGGLNILQGKVLTSNDVSGIDKLSISDVGQLNVTGNYTQAANSVYEVQTNENGNSGQVNVSGTATPSGAQVQLANNSTFNANQHFTILTAGTLTGTYDNTVIAPQYVFITPTLSQTEGTNGSVVLNIGDIRSFADAGSTFNQRSTANAVEGLGTGNPLYNAVLNLHTQEDAQNAFKQLSGEIHASAGSMLFLNSSHLRDTLNRRMDGGFQWGSAGDGSKFAENATSLGVYGFMPLNHSKAHRTNSSQIWAQGFGSRGHLDGDGNAATLTTSTSGVLVGADTPLGQNWRGGLAAGIDRTDFDVDDRNSTGKNNATHLAAYAGTQTGPWKLHLGAAYSWDRLKTTRNVTFPSAQNLNADYDANTLQLFGEAGYQKKRGNVTYEPFLGLAYVKVKTDGFNESGGSAALSSSGSSDNTTYSTLGIRASTQSSPKLSLRGMLGWRHAFSDVTPAAYVKFAGGNTFQVNGVPIANDSLLAQLGVDYRLGTNTSLGLTYAGQFGGGNHANTLAGSINYLF